MLGKHSLMMTIASTPYALCSIDVNAIGVMIERTHEYTRAVQIFTE